MTLTESPVFVAFVAYGNGGGYGIESTPAAALTTAGRHVAMTQSQTRKAPHYVLEFPPGSIVNIGMTGNWSSDNIPVRVERFANLPAGVTSADLLGRKVPQS